jgi:glycosyltransferase involved in cell wall biosynthesis
MDPKITVVVPTRERCDTLYYCLKTCYSQDYDNLTILISDNFSQDKTNEVVAAISDKRIQYVNTGRRLSMSLNWEFALSFVTDGYVLFLGDDDGLLPESIKHLASLILQTNSDAICWRQASYQWSRYTIPDKNNLLLPLGKKLIKLKSKDILSQVLKNDKDHKFLPSIYWGIVSNSVINKIKRKSGRFFNSMIPDIFSSIAVASVVEEYLYSERPYSIAGLSHHSTGTAMVTQDNNNNSPLTLFFSEGNIPVHKELTMATSLPIIVAESFLQVKDHIEPSWQLPELDFKNLIYNSLFDIITTNQAGTELVYKAVDEIAKKHNLIKYKENLISNFKFYNYLFSLKRKYNQLSSYLYYLNIPCNINIKNIYEASIFFFYSLKLFDTDISFVNITLRKIKYKIFSYIFNRVNP